MFPFVVSSNIIQSRLYTISCRLKRQWPKPHVDYNNGFLRTIILRIKCNRKHGVHIKLQHGDELRHTAQSDIYRPAHHYHALRSHYILSNQLKFTPLHPF